PVGVLVTGEPFRVVLHTRYRLGHRGGWARSTLRMWSLWPGGTGDINSRSHGPVFRHGRARGESDSCHGHLRCCTGAASCRRSAPAVVLRTLQGVLMFSGKRILAGASAVAL